MITLPKDEEAKLYESQRSRLSPSSPSSSRSIPFRDDPTESDALLGDTDTHSAWHSRIGDRRASTSSAPVPGYALVPGPSAPDASPPPRFAPYQAEFFEVGYEDICSHDPHLNSDGEALYRFILNRAQRPPFMRVHIEGTHTEHKTRWVTHTGNDGRTRQELENYSETVTDFSFCVDIKPVFYTTRTEDGAMGKEVPIDPVHWTVADHVPAYRGKMVKEVEALVVPALGSLKLEKKKCKRKERKAREKWEQESSMKGLPPWCEEREVDFEGRNPSSLFSPGSSASNASPWVNITAEIEKSPLRSSRTVRQWADDYCSSPKRLKEFVYVQELYGWNMQQIESAIRSTILATPYHGDLNIHFTKHRSKIYIRPDNAISRMLSNKWLKFLSIIFLIYPFIWLFKRFHSRGGGRWEVCGAAYPLKRWVPLDDGLPPTSDGSGLPPYSPYQDNPSEASWQAPSSHIGSSNSFADAHRPLSISRSTSSSSRVMQTSTGPKKLLGQREGEWFRRWEKTITRAVLMRYRSHEPLPEAESVEPAVSTLDGY